MEPDNQFGTVSTNQKWQLRWGHILLALFFIVLIIIAYIVVHQIKTADKSTQSSLSNGHHATTGKNKSSSSAKTPVATAPKSSSQPQTKSGSSTPPATSTGTGKSSSSNALVNTGPGDTIALFIGATTLGTLGHYFYTKRRLGFTE
jgi:hypothetical protein